MKFDFISPPNRKFGNSVTDLVQIRGLSNGGPYRIPDHLDRIYIAPIIIRTPSFNINNEQTAEFMDQLDQTMKHYLKLRVEIINIKDKSNIIDLPYISKETIRELYNKLVFIKEDLRNRGYDNVFRKLIIIIFTKQTSPMLKITPYYISKLVFSNEPASQVVTENAFSRIHMSVANIALGIFTKLGGIPWRLVNIIPSTDAIIGVGVTQIKYYSEEQKEITHRLMGSVAFIRSDGIFDRADAVVVSSREELAKWITRKIYNILNSIILRTPSLQLDVTIHYSGKKPADQELKAIEEIVEKLKKEEKIDLHLKIVHITDDIPHRFMSSAHKMYPPGGFYWITSNNEAYLIPIGAITIRGKSNYSFTGIPHTLKLRVIKRLGDMDPSDALLDAINEVYHLTFMHLSGLNLNIGEPVSTKYSRELAYLAGSLKVLLSNAGIQHIFKDEYDRLWFL